MYANNARDKSSYVKHQAQLCVNCMWRFSSNKRLFAIIFEMYNGRKGDFIYTAHRPKIAKRDSTQFPIAKEHEIRKKIIISSDDDSPKNIYMRNNIVQPNSLNECLII
jgi:hypothetical protein